jgi:hypothetical protein
MARFLWLVVLLLGCGPTCALDEAVGQEAVLSAWEEKISPVSETCAIMLAAYEVELADPERCKCGGKVHGGCVDLYGGVIYITDADYFGACDRVETHVHELVHVLAFCEWRDTDADHENPVLWGGPGSVEDAAIGRL